jgi:hypothetical protein
VPVLAALRLLVPVAEELPDEQGVTADVPVLAALRLAVPEALRAPEREVVPEFEFDVVADFVAVEEHVGVLVEVREGHDATFTLEPAGHAAGQPHAVGEPAPAGQKEPAGHKFAVAVHEPRGQ